jgi:hypothetical protein
MSSQRSAPLPPWMQGPQPPVPAPAPPGYPSPPGGVILAQEDFVDSCVFCDECGEEIEEGEETAEIFMGVSGFSPQTGQPAVVNSDDFENPTARFHWYCFFDAVKGGIDDEAPQPQAAYGVTLRCDSCGKGIAVNESAVEVYYGECGVSPQTGQLGVIACEEIPPNLATANLHWACALDHVRATVGDPDEEQEEMERLDHALQKEP